MLPQNDLTFGLVGRKLGHSWSPQIHEMLGSAPYSLVELEPQEVEGFLRGGSWQGLNVTIPYKAVAAQVAGQTSERVRRLIRPASTMSNSIRFVSTSSRRAAWRSERVSRRG